MSKESIAHFVPNPLILLYLERISSKLLLVVRTTPAENTETQLPETHSQRRQVKNMNFTWRKYSEILFPFVLARIRAYTPFLHDNSSLGNAEKLNPTRKRNETAICIEPANPPFVRTMRPRGRVLVARGRARHSNALC